MEQTNSYANYWSYLILSACSALDICKTDKSSTDSLVQVSHMVKTDFGYKQDIDSKGSLLYVQYQIYARQEM